LDCDFLESQRIPLTAALDVLRGRANVYDPEVLRALDGVQQTEETGEEIREVSVSNLCVGMVLLDPVETVDGRLLVAHGQEVSAGVVERLQNFSQNVQLKEPLRVLVRIAGTA
jgi:hypothetical protein